MDTTIYDFRAIDITGNIFDFNNLTNNLISVAIVLLWIWHCYFLKENLSSKISNL